MGRSQRWQTHFSKYLYTKFGVYQVVSYNEKDYDAVFLPKDKFMEDFVICKGVSKHTAMKRCRVHQRKIVDILKSA